MEVVRRLLLLTTMGKLAHGAIVATASELQLHRTTVSRVWKDFQKDAMVPSLKAGRVGRTPIYSPELVTVIVRELQQSLRITMRDMSEATWIPLSTLHRHLREGTIKRHSTRIKPLLTDKNKVERLEFLTTCGTSSTWTNSGSMRTRMFERCSSRKEKSKQFIPKVMLLATVARPRHDDERGTNFDGKIGIWTIVEYLPAVRNSRNHPAGTIVPTLVNVDAVVYQDYGITRVIPAIKLKFPTSNKRVVLQHNNATPHGGITTADLACVSTDGWSFAVRCQLPNSPDLNVLDLGFFASIQSLQHKLVSRTLDDVIRATHAAFELTGGEALATVFLSFQAVMRLVLENNGGNQFRLSQLRKDALKRAGALMTNVPCPTVLLE